MSEGTTIIGLDVHKRSLAVDLVGLAHPTEPRPRT
jgi:hypothetical protein